MRTCLRTGLLIALLLPVSSRQAQPQNVALAVERDSVLSVVENFLTSWAAGDSATALALVHPGAQLTATIIEDDEPVTSVEPVAESVRRAAEPRGQAWDMRLLDPDIQVSGPLASVWSDYRLSGSLLSDHGRTRSSWCGLLKGGGSPQWVLTPSPTRTGQNP